MSIDWINLSHNIPKYVKLLTFLVFFTPTPIPIYLETETKNKQVKSVNYYHFWFVPVLAVFSNFGLQALLLHWVISTARTEVLLREKHWARRRWSDNDGDGASEWEWEWERDWDWEESQRVRERPRVRGNESALCIFETLCLFFETPSLFFEWVDEQQVE